MAPKPSSSASITADSGLPDFENPPIDEVALSVQFAPLSGFGVPQFGLYWHQIREAYPRSETKPPIANVTEQFGPTGAPYVPTMGFQVIEEPEVRCWFLSESGNRLIQIQRDRFVSNWRKLTGQEEYPRYPELRAHFDREWNRFREFLRAEKLEQPQVNQCEVTYVNHIEYGVGWNNFDDLNSVVSTIASRKARDRFLPPPDLMTMAVVYPIEDSAGRLHIAFSPVLRARDGKKVLRMTLTARGAPKTPSDVDVLAWLDQGRRWVVRGFADFTTDKMHQVWGKR